MPKDDMETQCMNELFGGTSKRRTDDDDIGYYNHWRPVEEIWKECPIVKPYQVSTCGRVRNPLTGKIHKLGNNVKIRYPRVKLYGKVFNVHRLVAITFLPNPDNKPCVDHINTIVTDNRVENLRWATYSENSRNSITLKKNIVSHIGKVVPEEVKIKKRKMATKNPIICIETGIVYESIKDCRRKTGIHHIAEACKGIRKIAGGYHWRYCHPDGEKIRDLTREEQIQWLKQQKEREK